jgi:hypothetical protein
MYTQGILFNSILHISLIIIGCSGINMIIKPSQTYQISQISQLPIKTNDSKLNNMIIT